MTSPSDYTIEELCLPWNDEEFTTLFVRTVSSPDYRETALSARDLVNEVVKRMNNG